MAISTVLTCALDRNTPRTCTPENAVVAINGDNEEAQATLVADLAMKLQIVENSLLEVQCIPII